LGHFGCKAQAKRIIMIYPNKIEGSLYCEAFLDKPCTLDLMGDVYYSDQFQIKATDLDFSEYESRAVIRGTFSNLGEFAIMPQFPNKKF
jgi:hypothetical protein